VIRIQRRRSGLGEPRLSKVGRPPLNVNRGPFSSYPWSGFRGEGHWPAMVRFAHGEQFLEIPRAVLMASHGPKIRYTSYRQTQ